MLEQFLSEYKNSNVLKNIIVYNLPVCLEFSKIDLFYKNVFAEELENIISSFGVNLGFSLLRYSRKFEK